MATCLSFLSLLSSLFSTLTRSVLSPPFTLNLLPFLVSLPFLFLSVPLLLSCLSFYFLFDLGPLIAARESEEHTSSPSGSAWIWVFLGINLHLFDFLNDA